jgi:hypothetical protein
MVASNQNAEQLCFQRSASHETRALRHMVGSGYALCWLGIVRGDTTARPPVNFCHPRSRRKLPVWIAVLAILIDVLLPIGVAAARYGGGASPTLAICGDRSSGAPIKHEPLLPMRHCALCCFCSVHGLAPNQIGSVPRPVVSRALVHVSWSLSPLPGQPDLRGAVLPRGPPVAV